MLLCLVLVKSNLDIVGIKRNQERFQAVAVGGMRFRKHDLLEKTVGIRFSQCGKEKVEVEDVAADFWQVKGGYKRDGDPAAGSEDGGRRNELCGEVRASWLRFVV